jgi:hypothetical protein
MISNVQFIILSNVKFCQYVKNAWNVIFNLQKCMEDYFESFRLNNQCPHQLYTLLFFGTEMLIETDADDLETAAVGVHYRCALQVN